MLFSEPVAMQRAHVKEAMKQKSITLNRGKVYFNLENFAFSMSRESNVKIVIKNEKRYNWLQENYAILILRFDFRKSLLFNTQNYSILI